MSKKKNRSNKPLMIFWVVAAVLLIALIALNWPEEKETFKFSDKIGKWMAGPGVSSQLENDQIILSKSSSAFFIIIPEYIVDADSYDVAEIILKSPVAFDQGRLLFISPFNDKFSMDFALSFDSGPANKFNRVLINLNDHPAWQKLVRGFILIPSNAAGKISLESITFIKANPLTKLRAGWAAFTYYTDPLLGTCFAMASPVLFGRPFNSRVIPVLWILIVLALVLVLITTRFRRITLAVLFAVILTCWGILDLRDNVYYYKSILRDANLYWGKPLQVKRGIVTGDPEFIQFIKFCDENIPLDGQVVNYVPLELPGTPVNYLSTTQFYFNMRIRFNNYVRFTNESAKPYYVFYKPKTAKIDRISQEQFDPSVYPALKQGVKLRQEIRLMRDIKDLLRISITPKDSKEVRPDKLALSIYSDDGTTRLAEGKFDRVDGRNLIFNVVPLKDYQRNKLIFLEIVNLDEKPLEIGVSITDLYAEGKLVFDQEINNGDLAFRLDYKADNLKLFKQFNEHAFILTE